MIFYFTSTGNSLYVARQLDPAPYSIVQALKQNELTFSDEVIGIVSPVYAGELPHIVRDFLQKAKLSADYIFMVLTYGNDVTVAPVWSRDFAARCGVRVDYVHTVRMADNYLPAFDMREQAAKDNRLEQQLAALKTAVKSRTRQAPKSTLRGKILYRTVQRMFTLHPEQIDGSALTVTDRCTGCGICTKVCPRGLFTVESGRVIRTQTPCEFCLACIQNCPEKAITLATGERNAAARYRNPNVTLQDIITVNDSLTKENRGIVMETITLNNGVKMPMVGIGTFLLSPDEAETSVLAALETGCRLIDTANAYVNEKAVGRAMQKSGVPRGEIFLETKLWPSFYEQADAVDKTLERLGTDYIDLLLIHQPAGNYIAGYKLMEKAYKEGKVKAIGLSNMDEMQVQEILDMCEIKPSVLQTEVHPYAQNTALKSFLAKEDIVIQAWYPLGHGDKALIEEPVFTKLAEKYGKSNAQIILRWHVQSGNIVIPGSKNPAHIRDNFDLFDFNLTDDEMAQIAALNREKHYYTSTPELLKQYATMVPPVDEQK